jgi:hypothetical protein
MFFSAFCVSVGYYRLLFHERCYLLKKDSASWNRKFFDIKTSNERMNAVTWRHNSFLVSTCRVSWSLIRWSSCHHNGSLDVGCFSKDSRFDKQRCDRKFVHTRGEGGVGSMITPYWYLFADRCTRIILLYVKLYHLRAPDSCTNLCANTISRGYSTHVWCKKHKPSIERDNLKGLQERLGFRWQNASS